MQWQVLRISGAHRHATPHRYNKYSGSCTFCCGRPSGLLCWLRGAGKENSESTL